MVSQLQLALLMAHNRLLTRARKSGLSGAAAFERSRTTLRWLYQHVVWNDFLPRVTDAKLHACALRLDTVCHGRKRWVPGLDDVFRWKNAPFMPVEFSVAAYRFGHSLVRNAYQTNQPLRGFGNFAPIFDDSGAGTPDDLRGFRPMKQANVIQWDWFLEMTSSAGPFPQRARKIDTKLSNALSHLPFGPPGPVLAARNLLRGVRFDLPSGSDVARRLGLKPIDLGGAPDALWYYVLKEAETLGKGDHLGPVGSTIVCATFAGLLHGDPSSYFHVDPTWTPGSDALLKDGVDNIDSPGKWTLAAIIRLAGLPVAASDFPS